MTSNFNNSLFDGKVNVLGGSLGLRLARHDISSSNLANMDTPGFRAKHLRFEEVLARQLDTGSQEGLPVKQTNKGHMPDMGADRAFSNASKSVFRSPYGFDENDDDVMDIDKEMTLLTKNQLIYNTTVQMLAKSFEGLKYAIGEGSGG